MRLTQTKLVEGIRKRKKGPKKFFQEILSCLREKPASLLNMLDLPMEVNLLIKIQALFPPRFLNSHKRADYDPARRRR